MGKGQLSKTLNTKHKMNTLHNRQFPLGIIHSDDKLIIITSQGTHYATTYDPSAARLISAAPDLLSALQGVADAYGCECLDTEPQSHCPMCIAREAIAKAKGAK